MHNCIEFNSKEILNSSFQCGKENDKRCFQVQVHKQKMAKDRYSQAKCVRINTLNIYFVDKAHISHGIHCA